MASIMTSAVQFYDDIMAKGDPRVEGYLLMDTPWPSFAICLSYVILVEYVLPKLMENRKPYDLRNVMMVYNFAMVLLSGYIFIEFGLSGWFTGYSYRCQPVDYSRSAKGVRMLNTCWWFFFSKFIELFDTVIFVARKKYNQVSFLHVFHHGVMPISWWFGVKFSAGGLGTFHALLNSFIHFLMYTYYLLAAMGPRFQKYLWWKKYMTSMQITQFILVAIHTGQLLFIECNYEKTFVYWIGLYSVIFLILFMDFYRKTYTKSTTKTAKKTDQNGAVSNSTKKLE